mmetsp:Transcript_4131/g.11784  ORF Transcript_4131/g.11784 Transcript_4131/m.11784 type:complete len:343 (+) Transcript_4131:1144-2172(+)
MLRGPAAHDHANIIRMNSCHHRGGSHASGHDRGRIFLACGVRRSWCGRCELERTIIRRTVQHSNGGRSWRRGRCSRRFTSSTSSQSSSPRRAIVLGDLAARHRHRINLGQWVVVKAPQERSSTHCTQCAQKQRIGRWRWLRTRSSCRCSCNSVEVVVVKIRGGILRISHRGGVPMIELLLLLLVIQCVAQTLPNFLPSYFFGHLEPLATQKILSDEAASANLLCLVPDGLDYGSHNDRLLLLALGQFVLLQVSIRQQAQLHISNVVEVLLASLADYIPFSGLELMRKVPHHISCHLPFGFFIIMIVDHSFAASSRVFGGRSWRQRRRRCHPQRTGKGRVCLR